MTMIKLSGNEHSVQLFSFNNTNTIKSAIRIHTMLSRRPHHRARRRIKYSSPSCSLSSSYLSETQCSPCALLNFLFLAPLILQQLSNHFTLPSVSATEQDLINLITRLNSDVIELRNEIESSISTRCDSIRGCYQSSYDECQSEYDTSSQTCPSVDELGYAIEECGAGIKCNGLFDSGVTTVRIPEQLAQGPNRNPTNPSVSFS